MQTAQPSIAFRPGDHIVYPAHGVGRVMGVEQQSVAGIALDVFVISFEQDKMTLRVPTTKARSCGMRALASSDVVDQAMKTLQGRARIKRTMWSRRAQEDEAKINSGDLVSIAADGVVTFHVRGSGVINAGGEKVFAEEVENCVRRHPAVRDVMVVGVPDPRWGHRIAAVPALAGSYNHSRAPQNVIKSGIRLLLEKKK